MRILITNDDGITAEGIRVFDSFIVNFLIFSHSKSHYSL